MIFARVLKVGKKPVPEVINKGDVIELAKSIDDSKIKALFCALYLTGGRITEVLNLKPKDIELVESKDGKTAMLVKMITLKNKKTGVRIVPIDVRKANMELIKPLLELRQKTRNDDKMWGDMSRNLAFYYISKLKFELYVRKAGGETERVMFKLHPHYLRHVALTHLVSHYDFTDSELKQFAGWSNTVPAATYVHLKYKDILNKLRATTDEA